MLSETFILLSLTEETWRKFPENPELSPRMTAPFVIFKNKLETTLLLDEVDFKKLRHAVRAAKIERNFRLLTFYIKLDFSVVGFLAEITRILAEAGVSIAAYSSVGVGGASHARDIKPSDFRRVIDTNLIGAMNSVAAVLPQMIEQGSGQIVGVSSLAGFRGLPKSAAYCASKAGMTAYLESVRLDAQNKNIFIIKAVLESVYGLYKIKTGLTTGARTLLSADLAFWSASRGKGVSALHRIRYFCFKLV